MRVWVEASNWASIPSIKCHSSHSICSTLSSHATLEGVACGTLFSSQSSRKFHHGAKRGYTPVPLTFFVVVVMVHVPPSHFSRHIAYQTRSKHLPSLQNSVRETWKRSLLHRACFSLWSSRRNITHSHFLFGVVGVPCYA